MTMQVTRKGHDTGCNKVWGHTSAQIWREIVVVVVV